MRWTSGHTDNLPGLMSQVIRPSIPQTLLLRADEVIH